ncbi:hypothetical protein [Lentzea flava]|uniref:Tetratricopeptide repeat-containing protein n=1 Tax=Lentzea flava TaxID=103732 RepID=A0ABQ2VCA5_9PSEU|nr:hypothetical protein [Lentzea flava]MCP2204621.1 hypothetical protein [Lentzea flava]GGU79720.1 hypothetical protein GCM10010178_83220 [Lentzea flava]
MSLARLEEELARPRLRPDVELAVVLSVATRIEIELVRAVRLKVLPHLDVGAESDFWFSEWIGARQPRVVALRPDLLEPLRARLNAMVHAGTVRSLRAVIKHVHTDISAALQLEEDVNWRACTGEHGGFAAACALLRSGTKAMAVEYRDGVAGWVAEAKHRLPRDVMMSEDGWHLVLHAKYLRPDSISDAPTDGDVEHLLRSLLLPAAYGKEVDATRRTLAVRWKGGTLVLGGHEEGAVTIALLHHVPPVVELTAHGQSEGRWVLVEEEFRFTPPEKGPVRLRTVDGRVFHIPDAVGDSVQASPVLIRTHGPAGEPARFWLQPVRFDTDDRARAGQPIALLGKVLSAVPVDAHAAGRLRAWLDHDEHTMVRLLHGTTEEQRVRLATQIAAASSEQGWQVYRGRQDPEAAHWLDTTKPEPGRRGILLVVDRADTWHPRHLRDMLIALTAYRVRTRVLLLSAEAGSWWQALVRTLEGRGVDTGVQPITGSRTKRNDPETYRSSIAVLAATMSLDMARLLPKATMPRTDEAAEPVAVATVLDALTKRKPAPSARARQVILRHEHNFLTRKESGHRTALARLVFLATLLRPLRMQDARELSFHFGLTDQEGWPALLAAYERHYSLDQDTLDPLGASHLRDDLLAAALIDGDPGAGVDPEWARGVLRQLDRDFRARAVGVLAHAAQRFPRLALLHMNPMVWHEPELLVKAGAAAIIAAIGTADTELLQKVSSAVPAPHERDLRLDPAVARLEEVLVGHLFVQGTPGPERDAPLHLRLARSRARAGLTEAALTAAHDATLAYRRLVVNKLRNHTQSLCESLILESELLGELGQAGEAFETAQDAERRLRELQRRMRDRPGANLGVALANLGRQKARARGDKRQALDDLKQAVKILVGLAADQPAEYRPELAEALVTLSERAADAGSLTMARECAEEAVELARLLEEHNSWAHGYRLGAALLCLSARQETGEAVASTTEAVRLYRKAASAAPDRFGPHLALALTRHATLLSELGSKDDAVAAVEEAVSLYERTHSGYAGELAAAVALRDRWRGGSA